MNLVDTSVWVDHLGKGSKALRELLEQGLVVCHPFVIGELACGRVRNRAEILTLLAALPAATAAGHAEAMRLASDRKLHGKGLGWVDVHLLASALLSGCTLWTKDKALRAAARALNVES
ncbi:MAG: type II toxin-antitoxin system VapC family toxin [Planctomycetota bacterium]|jgi:predicted nucleic acid-binding protein